MLNASLVDVPRPFIDPIDSLAEALGVLALALPRPLTDATLMLALDHRRRGLGMVRTSGLTRSVVHQLIGSLCDIPGATSAVVASTRARSLLSPTDSDELRAHQCNFSNAGMMLLDWIVIGRGGLYCPRSVTGDQDPWPSAVTFR